MNTYEKNYLYWYVKTNRKLFAMLIGLLVVCLPLLSILSPYDAMEHKILFDREILLYVGSMIVLVFAFPLYNFRFLMKKCSVDTFFTMPIKRKRFFTLQFFLGLISILLLCNSALIISMICERATWKYIGEFLYIMGIASFFASCLYTLYTYLIMKCNNLWDAIIICIGYTVLPIFLYMALDTLISNTLSSFLVSQVASIDEVLPYHLLFTLISIPAVIMEFATSVLSTFYNTKEMGVDFVSTIWTTQTFALLYWGVIGAVLYIKGRISYGKRCAEASEQRTTSWLCYPVLIVLITMSLLMNNGLSLGLDSSILDVLIIFIMYLIMVFFANRKIALTKSMLAIFLGLMAIVISITYIFTSTRGFNKIKEFPNIDHVQEVQINVTPQYNDPIIVDGEEYNWLGSEGLNKEEEIEYVYGIQEYLVNNTKKIEDIFTDELFEIYIHYSLKDGSELYRRYYFKEKEIRDECNKRIETMIKNGYFDEEIERQLKYK